MTFAQFRVEPADYRADFDDLRSIRYSVFVEEQHIDADIEFDAIDVECYHVIARDNLHTPIGTARLSPDFKIGRMAVLQAWRGQGVGSALVQCLIDKARRSGCSELELNAQVTAVGFYEKFGFGKVGNSFIEANIPHQRMMLAITPIDSSIQRITRPRRESVASKKLVSLESYSQAVLDLINDARRQLCIFSPDLEHSLYSQDKVIEAFKQFAINSRGGEARIIIQDIQGIRNQPHLLLDLAHRLPSTFLLRIPVEAEDLNEESSYLANDMGGFAFRLHADRYIGDWSSNHPARNRQILDDFDRIWQRSVPCIEFRALGI